MSLTIGLTGMDPATETSLKSAFAEANAGIGGAWRLVPETEAAFVLVDMDTLYGPMSWLRLHAADKAVIGLTTSARTQADFRLERPFTVESLRAVLCEIAAANGQPVGQSAPPLEAPLEAEPRNLLNESSPEFFTDLAASIPSVQPGPAVASAPGPVVTTSATAEAPAAPAPVAQDLPQAWVAPSAAAAATAPTTPAPSGVPDADTYAAPPGAAPVASDPTTLAGWLASGELRGRCRVRSGHLSLLIDNDLHTYYGPASLKPLAELFAQPMGRDSFEPVNDAAWEHDTAAQGGAQPLSRLVWFGGLLSGNGTLVSGFDPHDRYRLTKWPQTEREFPKHFRIATVMMKGPATLTEITDASGVTRQEVNDFVNASLATGFAEPYREPEPEPDANKAGGLFGRLRGR